MGRVGSHLPQSTGGRTGVHLTGACEDKGYLLSISSITLGIS